MGLIYRIQIQFSTDFQFTIFPSLPMIPQVQVEHKFNFTLLLKVPRLSFLFNIQSQSPHHIPICLYNMFPQNSKCLPSAKVMTFWHCR